MNASLAKPWHTHRKAVIAVAAIALIAAGISRIIASMIRWVPCYTDSTAYGRDCDGVQNSILNYEIPAETWHRIPHTLEWATLAFLLAALAITCLSLATTSTLYRFLLAPTAVTYTVITGYQLALLTGTVAVSSSHGWSFAMIIGYIGMFFLPVTLLAALRFTDNAFASAGTIALVLATPLPLFLISQMTSPYSLYDDAPFYEALGGILWVIAGIGFGVGAAVRRVGNQQVVMLPDVADEPTSTGR